MTKDKDINIAANDETIISGANDLSYMYSVNDVHNITIALRQKYLNYEGMQDANPGEEYAYLRENNNQILLLDAYALQNLQNGIEDDVDKIIGEVSGTRWHNPPQTILIPFLTAAHWISIKVDINYNDRSASLLWDNPYGLSYEAGEYQVAGKTISSIDIIANVRSAVQRLMKHYLQNNEFTLTENDEGNWTLNHQQMDQQGLGIDGVSCGTITLRNIEDYLDARIHHGQNLPTEYTIPAYKSNYMQNRTKLHAAKKEHVKMYCKVAEEDIPDDTDSILSAFDEQESDRVIAEFEKKLFPQGINHEDSILPNIEEEKAQILAEIKDAYRKTQEYVDASQFKEAEEEIVKILRPVLSKPEAKSLYVSVKDIPTETLSALHYLGQIYLQDSSYYNNHVKASAIFQYCARFSKEYKITIELPDGTAGDEQYFTKQAYLVERDFLSNIGKKVDETASYVEDSANKLELYQSELLAIREITKEELEDIESLGIEQITERTEKVQDIYKDCTDFFVTPDKEQQGLVQRLIFESIEQLGDIPQGCQYSIMGLGSLAFGTMTPWSDLEFAVLIKDKENKGRENEYREYFRNLTKLLWIKVINFGETPLSAVGVDSLNNYRTGEAQDNWFEDNITGKAFRFDPVYEDACKSALGRQGDYIFTKKFKNKDGIEETKTIEKPNYELIKTPKEMMEFQDKVLRELPEDETGKEKQDTQNEVDNTQDSWFYAEKHLVQTLQTPVLINGNKELLGEYRQELKKFRDDNPELVQTRALQLLQEDTNKFSLKLGDKEEGKLFNAKTTIYRLGDRIVNALANYYGITTEEDEHSITVWQIIDRMEQRELLSSEGAQHLREAISISTGLRLSTYSHNEGRFDNLSTYEPIIADHLNEKQKKELMEKTFHVHDTSILHHFYYVMLSWQTVVTMLCNKDYHDKAKTILIKDNLCIDNNYIKGLVHAKFLEYDKAVMYMEEAQKDKKDDINLLNSLFLLYTKLKIIDKAIEAIELLLILVTKSSDYMRISSCYQSMGNVYSDNGLYDKAINCYLTAIDTLKIGVEKNTKLPLIATIYSSLGNTYRNKKDYSKSIMYHKKSLKINTEISQKTPNPLDLAIDYNNLGCILGEIGDYYRAGFLYSLALKIKLKFYKNNPNHPDVAIQYSNLGVLFQKVCDYNKALKYGEIAIKMREVFYTPILQHLDIAISYNNIGASYIGTKDYVTGIGLYMKSLQMKRQAYISNPVHPNINHTFLNIYFSTCKLLAGKENLPNDRDSKVRELYRQVDPTFQLLKVTNTKEIKARLKASDLCYQNNQLSIAAKFQEQLIKMDPELKYGNHYYKLGCFFAYLGNISGANDSFIQALTHPNTKVTAGLYAEYAQFLILNKNNLSINSSTISKYLYAAINCSNIDVLQYGKTEKSTICSILCNIVKEQSTTIMVNPKILAYYLLITNPEYIAEGDSVENLLSSLKFICGNQQDEISFRLLADAYKFVGNEKLSEESLIFSSMLSQVYKIVNKKLKLGDDGCTLTPLDAQKVAEAIDKSATQAILDKRFSDSLVLFKKVFQIYNLILSDQIEHLQTAANKLATISLLTNNIQQFIELKFQFHAELNHDLIKSLGKNIDHIIAIEQQIITKVIAEQKKHTAHATATNQDTEDQIVSAGETEDTTDST